MQYYVIRKISLIITFHCETASCSESPDPSSFSPPPCHLFPAARRVWPSETNSLHTRNMLDIIGQWKPRAVSSILDYVGPSAIEIS